MLRKRSRARTSKQALMADYGSVQPPTDKYRRPISSFFSSPRMFAGFGSKAFSDFESVMSPTSILDSKPFTAFANAFRSDNLTPKPQKSENKSIWDKLDSKGVGLAIVDSLGDDMSDSKPSKPQSRMVLFGSQLKIQVPPLLPSVPSPGESPKSPPDFGIKTRISHLGSFPSPAKISPSGPENPNSPRVFRGCLSLSATEMELSEDYTCVISHGPNPKTTHIFDDCVVECCCGAVGFSASSKENEFFAKRPMSYPSESFLSFCHSCKKNIGQGKDIYMYRGDKAFCSNECRHKEMMLQERVEESECDDV